MNVQLKDIMGVSWEWAPPAQQVGVYWPGRGGENRAGYT